MLHVARLARLALTDDEVERLTDELGAILDAVGDRRRARSRRRAADVAPARPRQRLGRGRAARVALAGRRLRERARARRRPLPRPADCCGARRSTRCDSRPKTRSASSSAREVSPRELHAAYLDAIAERDGELHCYLRTVERAEGDEHPDRAQGRHLDEGRRDDGRLEDPRGLHARVRRDRRRALQGGRAVAPRQDEHGRVRDGLVDRELGVGAVAQSVGSVARSRRLGRRHGRGGLGRPRAVGARLRHRRLDQAAVGALRERRAAADVRHRLALRRRRVRVEPRPDRPGREDGARRRAPLLDHRGPRSCTTRRRSSCPSRCSFPTASSLDGAADRRAEADRGARRDRARRARGVRGAARAGRGARRRGGGVRPPALVPLRDALLLPRSPRPRRPRTSRATTAFATGRRGDGATYREMVERTRDEGFGAEPKRRIMLGTYALSAGYYDAFYGQAQKVRTLLIREHREALERFDVIVTPTSPTVAFPLGDKAADPLAMYACDLLTIPSCLAGLPGLSIPCGLSDGLPVGLQLDRPAVRREQALPRRARARAGDRLRHGPGEAPRMTRRLGAGHRPRDPRPAEDADEDVLPLPGRFRRGGEHADVPGVPRLPGRAAGA